MPKVQPDKYLRKPMIVRAVQVTKTNIRDVAEWCGGTVLQVNGPLPEEIASDVTHFIEAPVAKPFNLRQKQAYPGDWVIKSSARNWKVYTDKAFSAAFVKDEGNDPIAATIHRA